MRFTRWIGPVAVLTILLCFLVWSDSADFRHGLVPQTPACAIGQLKHLPADTDFIAIGSSRVLFGIDPETLRIASGGLIQKPFNLGRAGLSAARSYSVLRDLLAQGVRPKYAYFEVDLDAIRNAPSSGRITPDQHIATMSYRDIALLREAHADRPVLEGISAVTESMLKKLKTSLAQTLSGAASRNLRHADTRPPVVCWKPRYDQQSDKKIADLRERKASFQRAYPHAALASDNGFSPAHGSWQATQEIYFVRKMAELARLHGITFVIGRHWDAYSAPLSRHSLAEIRHIFPEFIYPPPELVRETWPYFYDPRHMGEGARRIYSQWLARQLTGSAT
jgi:hypothetical protein